MLQTSQDQLDHVFSALSDPTRRGMLARLADGETTVGALAEPYAMSQPAISKHVRVLERAGLVQRRRRGREHHIKVDPRAIKQATSWISRYARFWVEQFDAVDVYIAARSPDPRAPEKNVRLPRRPTYSKKER
jgi:DNA-binding transcriptional ArsR family regulator